MAETYDDVEKEREKLRRKKLKEKILKLKKKSKPKYSRASTMQFSKGGKTPDDQSKEYADEYKRRYGEDYPDQVKNAPYKVVGRKVKKITKKIKDKIKGIVGKKGGGVLKPVPEGNTGLGKLPTPVRNNMGYMKYGGKVKMMGGGKVMEYKKGGKVKRMSCPVDGMAKRGKTKVRRKGR